ncbi:MAG: glycoside hydrolase TIM-barrel-like domain-containing protein [Pseudomonadota bacterium]
MSQFANQAGQFVVTTARQVAPQVVAAAGNAAFVAAQNLIFGPVKRRREGPRQEELRLQTAAEGVAIPRLYGRQRIAGQILWATNFKETTEVTTTSTGGKGVRRSSEQEFTSYLYSVSLAIGLCEGEISRIGRVWADGKPYSLSDLNYRLYSGTEDQLPDALMESIEGVGNVPAYRGLAYLVFEDFPLNPFGNRIPQLNFEVERPLKNEEPDALENATRAVTIIPASGESVYHTEPVLVEKEEGITVAENVYNNIGGTDYQASMDHLTSALPNTEAAELIVSWFGTDLRAGECLIEPRVETRDKTTLPNPWGVNGLGRADVNPVSELEPGVPAYGGTPSDDGVRQALSDLKARGLVTVFYPFILMDVPPDNNLPNPYGGASQPPYPWRGRITCHPKASVDKTAAARTQVEAFFARYRVMILHYANICSEIGGVDAFVLGSELRELTNVRDEQNRFPAVEALISLAAEVRSILGPDVKISYAADWSEYSNYRPNDGSGDVYFHLDPLWADPNIGFYRD